MKNDAPTLSTATWLAPSEAKAMMTESAWALMSYDGSLTQKLRDITKGQIEFHFLTAGLDLAYLDEAEKLGFPASEPIWVRHIEMRYRDALWTVGRVLIPKSSMNAGDTDLKNIGEQSIGDVIFKDPNLKRSEFEYLLLDDAHPYYQHIETNLNEPVWVRRSVIHFRNKPILVVEMFLPDAL